MGLFLSERVLEWFKPYFTKIQLNGISTTLKLGGIYGKVLLRTKVKGLEYINTYKKCQKYNRLY